VLHDLLLLPVARPWLVAVLLVAAGLLWWAGWRLRRTTRRRLTVMALVGAVLVAVAGGANAANVYFSYLPHVGDVVGVGSWRQVPAGTGTTPTHLSAVMPADPHAAGSPPAPTVGHGAVTSVAVADRASGFGSYRAEVYLPPQYLAEPTRRFPVLYLLHGSPGVPVDWLRGGEATAAGDAQAAAGHPLVIVMPRDSHWWLDDSECVDGVAERADTYVSVDVVAAVDAQLRTVADRSHRAVGGMSAGGYCALNLGLRHRDTFAAIVDMSGLTVPTHAGGLAALFGSGPAGQARAEANMPALYVATLSPRPTTAVWMDAGSSDATVLAQMRPMAAALRERGYPVRLGTRPGAHTFHVWAPALREALPWVADQLGA